MKDRYQSNSCSKDPPSEMEEGVCREPSSEEESALNSISGGFPAKRTGWEGWSALSSISGGFGRQEDRFPEGSLAPNGSSCVPAKRPRRGNAKLGIRGLRDCKERDIRLKQTYGQGHIYACSPNCTRTVHSPFGETSRIASGSASISHPQHGILHPRFCKWSERYDLRT